jgi:hypothetical protein
MLKIIWKKQIHGACGDLIVLMHFLKWAFYYFKMRFKSVVILFLTITSNCICQTPGYMGKKLVAGYGFYASPYFFGPDGEMTLNTLHEGFVDYVFLRNVSVGCSVRYYHTISPNRCHVSGVLSTSLDYTVDDYQTPGGEIDINGLNYTLYFKIYQSHYSAPWGRYFMIGPTVQTFNATYDLDKMFIYEESINYYGSTTSQRKISDFGPTRQTFTRADLMLGFGRCRIISNHLTLDYGCNANVLAVTATIFDVTTGDDIISPANIPMGSYIERTASSRVRGANRFNVFIKVGVLF